MLATCTVLSFGYALHATAVRPEQAFFITPTRAWEFGIGALLTFAIPAIRRRLSASAGVALAWAGLAIILVCAVQFDADTAMPGTAAIFVVTGAGLFIVSRTSTPARWAPDRVLDLRPIQVTGDISYALYLWHWPLIILMPFIQGHPNGQRTLVGILVLTFVLAAFSTYGVENPIRFSTRRWMRAVGPTLATWLTAAAVLATASLLVVRHQANRAEHDRAVAANFLTDPPRCAGAASIDPDVPCHNPDLDRILVPSLEVASQDRPKIEGQSCASREPDEPIVPCTSRNWDDRSVPHVVIVGDSHARMMSTALQALADKGVLAWKGYFQSGCILTTDAPVRTTYARQCNSFKERLPGVIAAELDQVDFAIVTGRAAKFDGTLDQKTHGLTEAWKLFTDRGIPVVALSDIPEIGQATKCLTEHPRDHAERCARPANQVLTTPDPFLTAARAGQGTRAIDLHPYYCTKKTCPVVIGGVVVYADTNHLSATYVTTLAPILERRLRELGLLRQP